VAGNEYLQAAAPWTAIKTDRDRAAVVVRTAINLVALYARLSSPFIPFSAAIIAEAVGEAGVTAWPLASDAGLLDSLPRGRAVRAPEVLFKKIEDDQVTEWTRQFDGVED
jgi:methionyl-tRNA synthetase